ncbi:nitrogenase [Nitratidesulfovibrio sp. HK-II]|uniref:nitrogenase component 1 n=1 Tax=Nitratidesulfovibrio sp. HK-II TaxID=2009266 RepID=UPI000EEFE09D|nr:nitrogenase component 1 [Nitratidesulfovibrio sp. HK-II]GBO98103.1 nitrogenase FeMo-cofactor scaffold and assembly protein NifN [Nitratidesulfovibrio sp. HK-II]
MTLDYIANDGPCADEYSASCGCGGSCADGCADACGCSEAPEASADDCGLAPVTLKATPSTGGGKPGKAPRPKRPDFVSTTNACKLCTPLGAMLAFRGVEGAVPFLHGSQGCATYMRRYVISHYREPMDIASSSLGEKQAVYGGGPNLKKGILNVMKKYDPVLVGVATTCLTETIGDDVGGYLREFRNEFGDLDLPEIVHVHTPSYNGTHMEGWNAAVRALVDQLAKDKVEPHGKVALLPGFVSPADLRHLRDLVTDFGSDAVILPDLSDPLDGPALEDYTPLPEGGTPLADIRALSGAAAVIECGRSLAMTPVGSTGPATAGRVLHERFGLPLHAVGLPIGLRETDALVAALEAITGKPLPRRHELERGRFVDALVDGHKYVSGKRAVVYGEADLVIGLVSLLTEIGVHTVLAATGTRGAHLAESIAAVTEGLLPETPTVIEGADFEEIADTAEGLSPDLLVGNSKGYRYARQWNIPLVRAGFPIHDRFGGHRLLHVGYAGAQALMDRIVNAVIEKTQSDSPVGYCYL